MCIVFTHSYDLIGFGNKEPLFLFSNQLYNFAFVGLSIFFTISGYLIAKSADTSSSYKNYLWKRLLRIQPLLIVVTLLSILIGSLLTSLSFKDYFSSWQTFSYLRNILPALGVQFHLPGVFTTNILESGVNGSLWTLVVEERLYLLLLLIIFFKKFKLPIALLIAFLLNGIHIYNAIFPELNWLRSYDTPQITYSTFFINASLLYILKVNFDKYGNLFFLISASLIGILFLLFDVPQFVLIIVLPFLIISFAHLKWSKLSYFSFADYTYGIYIISFPVQQILVHYRVLDNNPIVFFVATILIVLPISALSWHFFEKKILAYKSFIK